MTRNTLTVVLAPGAWADGWSWAKVIVGLRKRGINAVTAALPLTTLSEDVAALDRRLERVDGRVVLVGHAYAGAVIGCTRNPKVKALVYVAALAPAAGETVAEVFYRNDPHPQAPLLAPDPHGLIWLPDNAFAEAFAQNASAEEQAVLVAVQRPISAACISVPVEQPLWREIPSWYLVATEDRMIVPTTQRFMAERMRARVCVQPVDHIPSVTAADRVVELIEAAAGELRP